MKMLKLDFLFPTIFGASGGIIGAITIGELMQTALSAAIFALIGGIIGFYVNKFLKKIDKNK